MLIGVYSPRGGVTILLLLFLGIFVIFHNKKVLIPK